MANVLIVCEIGINHQRSLDLAKRLADAGKVAGASVMKTQIQHDCHFCLPAAEILDLYRHCESINLPFACTAFDVASLQFLLNNCKMPFIKIASRNWGGDEVIQAAIDSGLPIILSCREDDDWHRWRTIPINHIHSVLHCVGEYPTPLEHANLRQLVEFRRGFEVPFGLSDHSANPLIPALAVALGAQIIEAHITLDRNQVGPDHLASLDVPMFKRMVENVRTAEKAL